MLADCSQLLDWLRRIVQDDDGAWWAYEHESNLADSGWFEVNLVAAFTCNIGQPDPQWRQEIYII